MNEFEIYTKTALTLLSDNWIITLSAIAIFVLFKDMIIDKLFG